MDDGKRFLGGGRCMSIASGQERFLGGFRVVSFSKTCFKENKLVFVAFETEDMIRLRLFFVFYISGNPNTQKQNKIYHNIWVVSWLGF